MQHSMEIEWKVVRYVDLILYGSHDNVKHIRPYLKQLSAIERKYVVCQRNPSIMCQAAAGGCVPMFNYLLKNCGGEVDMPLTEDEYWFTNSKSKAGRTPLLHAIYNNHFKIVKILLKNGANANSVKDRYGMDTDPPLFVACEMIHKGDLKIVNLLLKNGADVNLKNSSELSPLHAAAKVGNLDCIRILLDNGAVHCWDDSLSVLPFAAMHGREDVINLFIENTEQPDRVLADTNEVAGARVQLVNVDQKKPDAYTAKKWREAMKIRYRNKKNPILKIVPTGTLNGRQDIFQDQKEPQNVAELKKALSQKKLLHLSLLVYERVIGENNAHFVNLIKDALWLKSTKDYEEQHGIFLSYALSICSKHDNLSRIFVEIIEEMIGRFCKGMTLGMNPLDLLKFTGEAISVDTKLGNCLKFRRERLMGDFIQSLAIMCSRRGFSEIFKNDSLSDDRDIGGRLENCGVIAEHLKNFLRQMAKLNPVNECNQSLLHVALNPKENRFVYDKAAELFKLPNVILTKLLLENGFDVNWRNRTGNSCFMALLLDQGLRVDCPGMHFQLGIERVLDILLQAGVHEDITNKYGSSWESCHSSMPPEFKSKINEHPRKSLQCLAACVVVDSAIPYEDLAPPCIVSFINMHDKWRYSV